MPNRRHIVDRHASSKILNSKIARKMQFFLHKRRGFCFYVGLKNVDGENHIQLVIWVMRFLLHIFVWLCAYMRICARLAKQDLKQGKSIFIHCGFITVIIICYFYYFLLFSIWRHQADLQAEWSVCEKKCLCVCMCWNTK